MSFVFERPDLAQVQDAPRTRSSPRRTHTKSRLGCQACKKRRIKCDEAFPKCGQCFDKGVECIYTQRPPPTEKTSAIDPSKPAVKGPAPATSQPAAPNLPGPPAHPPPEPMPLDAAKAQILRHLELTNIPSRHTKDVYQQHHTSHLIDHFVDTHYAWAGSPECQRVLQTWALTLAVTNPFLAHGILAFSASHLSALDPQDTKYSLAASLHYGLSLTGFATSLGTTVSGENADALFACCYLHAMLAFHYKRRAEDQNEDAEDTASDSDFAWLRLMKGIPILQRTNVLRPHLNKSLWLPVFIESGAFSPQTGPLPEPPLPERATHEGIEMLRADCGVTSETDEDENPYAVPLAHLDKLSRMTIDSTKVGPLMVFIGRMPEAFVCLVEKLDVRAMRALRFWCEFAEGVEQWWCRRPAREENERLARMVERKEALMTPESMG